MPNGPLQQKKQHMFEGSIVLSSTALILEALRAAPPTAISQTNRWVEPSGLNEKEVNSLKKKKKSQFTNSPTIGSSSVTGNLATHSQSLLGIIYAIPRSWKEAIAAAISRLTKQTWTAIAFLFHLQEAAHILTKEFIYPLEIPSQRMKEAITYIHVILTSFLLHFLLF